MWKDPVAYFLAVLLIILLIARRTRSLATRWRTSQQIEDYYKGRYALTQDDEKQKGLPRMNKCGNKGVHDAQTILRLVGFREMPFIFHKSLEFALFRTYAIPSISKILLRTGNLAEGDKSTRRYMDTVLLITSFAFYPLPRLDSQKGDIDKEEHDRREPPWLHDDDHMFEKEDPRGAIALARTNWLHRRANKIHGPKGAPISNEDLLYTLSVFITQPIEWVGRFGWRSMSALEQEAIFTVWEHIGKCMGIEGIPDTLHSLYEWAEEFEKKEMVYAPQNKQVAIETVRLLLYHVPRVLRPIFYPLVTSLLDERLRLGIGFAPASPLITWLPKAVLSAWSGWTRWFGLPRHDYGVRVPYYGDEKEDLLSAMCPASGKTAEGGGQCPAQGHAQTSSKPRMVPKWTDNEPHYMRSLPLSSFRGIYERIFVPSDRRWGSEIWQSVRSKDDATIAKHGYRLEECGPKGLEHLGRDEIRSEAERLTGQESLSGPWAI